MHHAFRVRFGEGLAAVRDEAEVQLYQAFPPLSELFNGLISLLENGWQRNPHLKIIVFRREGAYVPYAPQAPRDLCAQYAP